MSSCNSRFVCSLSISGEKLVSGNEGSLPVRTSSLRWYFDLSRNDCGVNSKVFPRSVTWPAICSEDKIEFTNILAWSVGRPNRSSSGQLISLPSISRHSEEDTSCSYSRSSVTRRTSLIIMLLNCPAIEGETQYRLSSVCPNA